MKKSIIFLTFSLFTIHCSLLIASGETWQELYDSTNAYMQKQDYETAIEWGEKALAQAEKEFGKLDTNYINILSVLVELHFYTDDYSTCMKYAKLDSSIRIKVYGNDHPKYAMSLIKLAYIHFYLDSFINAESLYFEALKIIETELGDDHPEIAHVSSNIAKLYINMERFEDAEQYCKKSAEINRREFGENHEYYATDLKSLADIYGRMGHFNVAEPLYTKTIDIYIKLFGEDHPWVATTLQSLGRLYELMGRYKEAESMYLKASKINKNSFGDKHTKYASCLLDLAVVLGSDGRLEDAENQYLKGIEIIRNKFGENHTWHASNLHNLALIYYYMGRFQEARSLNIEAKNIYKLKLGRNHHYYLIGLQRLARVNYCLENYDEAESLYLETNKIYETALGKDHPSYSLTLQGLSETYIMMGNLKKAESFFKSAFQDIAGRLKRFFLSLSEKEKEDFYKTFQYFFNRFISFAFERSSESPELFEQLYNNQLLTKGILISSAQKVRRIITNTSDSILLLLYNQWKDQREFIAKHYKLSKEELKKKHINIDSLEKVANDIEKELSKRSEVFAKEYDKKQYTWQDVQKALKDNEAAIEIVRFRKYGKIPNKFNPDVIIDGFTDTVYYAALIVSKETKEHPILVLLENGNDLESKYIELYRNQVNQQKKMIYDADESDKKLRELYKQFWQKIQDKLKGIKKVYLSPDGVYNQLNLNTLINPETGKYLLEELDLRIVTSSRDLMENVDNDYPPIDDSNIAVLFGDPLFRMDKKQLKEKVADLALARERDLHSMRGNFGELVPTGFSQLIGTREEIRKISDEMKKVNWKTDIYLGDEALEENVKALGSPRVLHIATHGEFLKDVEKSRDILGFGKKVLLEKPLLRSRLLFAGADNILKERDEYKTDTEDGLLTAYEAMNLNLDNTELVVLSACETGLGEVRNGEGVYGLQRAFQVAGAKTLIMSLWSVSDLATQELMVNFYKKWLSGKDKRESFREAQIELKAKYPGFYYWGAFVMVGE
ncbi:tetratricopeptide repeat protein [Bacteroidota bacterium]